MPTFPASISETRKLKPKTDVTATFGLLVAWVRPFFAAEDLRMQFVVAWYKAFVINCFVYGLV